MVVMVEKVKKLAYKNEKNRYDGNDVASPTSSLCVMSLALLSTQPHHYVSCHWRCYPHNLIIMCHVINPITMSHIIHIHPNGLFFTSILHVASTMVFHLFHIFD